MARQRIRLQQTNWAVAERLHWRIKGLVIERLQEQVGHSVKEQIDCLIWNRPWVYRDVLSQAVEQSRPWSGND